ncbi:DUF6531 domain-containing protein [Frankia sp. R82]|uniref:DUF6531 domain-containing protein n=1 Tax=Frankia sp. R82 TaxID=2950553 RepID=UPI0020444F8A|nr:DUF6531 domain-containing protein [Frankia sp. R82]MCM3883514.1 DUF6531 domain-containing protein [Frankia sp. R82]
MATSSADPDDLDRFVTDAHAAREGLFLQVLGVRAYYDDVVARLGPQYGLSHPDLWAKVGRHLTDAGALEDFVGAVRDAFVAADRGSGTGQVTVSDSRIAWYLEQAGITALPAETLTVDAPHTWGRVPDSGFVNDPVCTANGNFVTQECDLPLPGRAAVAGWQRTYNSRAAGRPGALGRGWSCWADAALDLGDDLAAGPVGAAPAAGRVGVSGPAELLGWRGLDGAEALVAWPRADAPTVMSGLGGMLHLDGDGFRFTRGRDESWWYDGSGRPVRVRSGPSEIVLAWADGRLERVGYPRSGRFLQVGWDDAGELITAVRASDGRVVRYSYDNGMLVAVEGGPHGAQRYRHEGELLAEAFDADGVRLFHNTYDGAGRVLIQATPEGRVARFDYPGGYRTLVTDSSDGPGSAGGGAINEYRHDAAGRLVCVVDDADRAFHRVFDEAGRLRGVRERSGASWSMDYDDTGNLTRRTGPNGSIEQWVWDSAGRLGTHTGPDGSRTRWLYAGAARTPVEIVDAVGAVTRITVTDDDLPSCIVDPDGVSTHLRWDGDGQLVETRVAGGGRVRLRYDAAGRLVGMVGADGGSWRWECDEAGRVVAQEAPDGTRSRFTHTPAGRRDGYLDPAGGWWRSRYGPHGLVEQVTDPTGSSVGFGYDLFGNTTSIMAPDGQVFAFEYDGLSRLTALRDPAGSTCRRDYDPDGRLTVEADADGREWRHGYDVTGQPTELTGPDGRVWRRGYDPVGRLVSETEPDGATVRHEYDPAGRRTAVIDAAGRRSTAQWTPGGRLAAQVTPSGRRTSHGYDSAGRLVQTVSPAGGITRYQHDPAGRPTTLATAAGRRTRWEYDARGDVRAITDPDGGRTEIVRNHLGLPTTVTGPDGAVHAYTYDARGGMVCAVDPLGAVTRYGYDVRGQLREWTDPAGGRHELGYDAVGWLTGHTDPLGRTTSVTHTRSGLVDTVRHADGTGLRWWHDIAGRPTGVGLPDEPEPRLHYSYDEADRLTRAHQTYAVPATHAIPTTDRPIATTYGATSDFADRGVALTYDVAGRLLTRSTAAGRLEWTYDPDGRCLTVGQPGRPPIRHDHDADGHLSAVEHPLLGRRAILRDADGRPLHAGRIVERDPAGRTTRLVDQGREMRFAYDAAGQLVTADGPWGRQTLTWDAAGRLRTETHRTAATAASAGTIDHWTYDAAGQLVEHQRDTAGPPVAAPPVAAGPSTRAGQPATQTSRTLFSYDAAGRRTTVTGPTGTRTYAWDAFGRISAVQTSGPSGTDQTINWVLDALGDPLQIDGTSLLWDPVTWPGTVHSLGTTTYSHTDDAIGVLPASSSPPTGPPSWYATDWQHSLGGAPGVPGAYDPWGSPIPAGPTDPPANRLIGLGYRGELTVDGLVWQRERLLDPATRSFLSPDPLEHVPGMPGAGNPYHYAWNDPVGRLDPTGLKPISDDAYDAYRSQQTRNTFGRAWHTIEHDPWGTLAAAGVIAVGVGLCFTPLAPLAAAGSGILFGAGISAGIGLATGSFDPRDVAISGAAGGVGAGLGNYRAVSVMTPRLFAPATTAGAATGGIGDLTDQELTNPGHLDVERLVQNTATGGFLGGASRFVSGRNIAARTMPVIGRLPDTAVAQRWPDHEVLALRPWLTGPWSEKINDRWINGIVREKRTVYLGSEPDMKDVFIPRVGESVLRVEVRALLQAGYKRVGDLYVPPGG